MKQRNRFAPTLTFAYTMNGQTAYGTEKESESTAARSERNALWIECRIVAKCLPPALVLCIASAQSFALVSCEYSSPLIVSRNAGRKEYRFWEGGSGLIPTSYKYCNSVPSSVCAQQVAPSVQKISPHGFSSSTASLLYTSTFCSIFLVDLILQVKLEVPNGFYA